MNLPSPKFNQHLYTANEVLELCEAVRSVALTEYYKQVSDLIYLHESALVMVSEKNKEIRQLRAELEVALSEMRIANNAAAMLQEIRSLK